MIEEYLQKNKFEEKITKELSKSCKCSGQNGGNGGTVNGAIGVAEYQKILKKRFLVGPAGIPGKDGLGVDRIQSLGYGVSQS